jgi:glucose-6-phosphate-specific signal transduction histidine kinase
MTIFMILAPYGIYAALMLVISATLSMAVAAALCVMALVYDIARGRSIKLLAAGSAVVFAAVACYRGFVDPAMSASAVKLAVDGGIFAISLGSLLLRMPFTLQYAIESVPAETAAMPGFLRANYVITGAWAGAALLMMIGNVMMIYVPGLPYWTGLAIAFAARNSALYFTTWYPTYRRLKDIAAQPAEVRLVHD